MEQYLLRKLLAQVDIKQVLNRLLNTPSQQKSVENL